MSESKEEQFGQGADPCPGEESRTPIAPSLWNDNKASWRSVPDSMPAVDSVPAASMESTDDAPTPQPLEADNRQWGLTDLGVFLLFALGTMVLVGSLVAGGFTFLNRVLGWKLSLAQPGVQTPIAVLVQILWEILWLGFIYQIVVVKYGHNFWRGLHWADTPIRTANFVLYGCALSVGIQLLSQLLPKRPELPIERLFDTPASAYLLAFFGVGVAPFMEELVFRGFFYPVLERRWGTFAAVLVTGSLFAAIHAPQLGGGGPELLAMLAVGLILSMVRARTGSLKPSFLIHFGYNASLFLLLFISTDRFQTLTN